MPPQEDIVVRADKYLSKFVPDLWRGDCGEMLAEAIEELKEYRHLGEVIAEATPCLTVHGDCNRCGTRMKARCDAITKIAQRRVGKHIESDDKLIDIIAAGLAMKEGYLWSNLGDHLSGQKFYFQSRARGILQARLVLDKTIQGEKEMQVMRW